MTGTPVDYVYSKITVDTFTVWSFLTEMMVGRSRFCYDLPVSEIRSDRRLINFHWRCQRRRFFANSSASRRKK